MAERLGLRLRGRGGRERGLGFCGRGRGRQQVHFLRHGAPEVIEGFPDVGRVVVGFVRILGCHLEHLRVDLLEGIDTLLELDIVRRELSLVISLSELLLDILLGPSSKRREGSRDVLPKCLELVHLDMYEYGDRRWERGLSVVLFSCGAIILETLPPNPAYLSHST